MFTFASTKVTVAPPTSVKTNKEILDSGHHLFTTDYSGGPRIVLVHQLPTAHNKGIFFIGVDDANAGLVGWDTLDAFERRYIPFYGDVELSISERE